MVGLRYEIDTTSQSVSLHITPFGFSEAFLRTESASERHTKALARVPWRVRDHSIAPELLVVWLSGNALVVINEVTLRQARLIQGWVTVCGQVNHLGM